MIAATAILGSLCGCNSPRQPATPTSGAAPSKIRAAHTPQKSNNSTAIRAGHSSAPSFGSWAAEVARRVRQYQKQKPTVARRTMNTGLSANTDWLVSRHPAWQLAQTLENNSNLTALSLPSPSQVAVAGVPNWRGVFNPGSTSSWLQNPSQSTLSGGQAFTTSLDFSPDSFSQPNGSASRGLVLARGLPALQSQMRRRQENTLTAFIGATQKAQQVAREADLQTRLAAMREDIERAREVNLAAVDPLLPEDPIQLEMTNLRLHLQILETPGNVYATPAEIASTRARLSELDAAWRRDLRAQESDRRELLARLRDERPRGIEAQRRREIEIAGQADQERDETLRQEASTDGRRRIAEDFEAADARLGIVIPSDDRNIANSQLRTRSAQRTSRPPQNLRTSSATGFTARGLTSAGWPQIESRVDREQGFAEPMQEMARLTPTERQAQIRRLRSLAWSDARQWSRVVARRNADLRKATLQRSLRPNQNAKPATVKP